MAFIGNTPTTQAFTPAVDYFSGNASTTAFTLSRPVASVAQVQVVVNNVAQNPSSAYTISSNTITFTSAPSSGTNNIYVYYTSPITQVIAPGQGTVNTTALGNITNIASGNSSLTLQTGSGNTTAVTVDTSQNVGVGTTSPARKLDVSSTAIDVAKLTTSYAGDATLLSLQAANGSRLRILPSSGTGNYNWQIAAQTNVSDGFEITPSTAAGGSTFSTPAILVAGATGNVGIGTSSPGAKLDIGNTNNTSFFQNSGATTGYAYTSYSNSGGNLLMGLMGSSGAFWGSGGAAYASTIGTTLATSLIFATNNAERMRINSSGYVTMPYQPGFRAGLDTSTAIASGGIFQFNSVSGSGKFNDGGYNPSSGRFTCPVAGRYLFLVEIIIQDLPNNTDMTDMAYPYINASQAGYSNRRAVYVAGTTGTSGYYVDTVFAIYKLAANDIVDVRAKTAYTQHGNANYSIFQGYFLG